MYNWGLMNGPNVKQFDCVYCGEPFVRYVPPSSKQQVRLYCNRSCQAKSLRNSPESGIKTLNCEHCKKEFTRYSKASQPARFCSRTCAQQQLAPGNRGYAALFKKWSAEHGEGAAAEMLTEHLQKRSDATSGKNNPRYGAVLTEETRHKQSIANEGRPNVLKGKTFVEFYGPDRAQQLGQQHSAALKAGFASGRLKPTARSGSAPTFRGTRLRSQLEQRAIEFLERRDGLVFGETLLYEDPSTFVQWVDAEGAQHTYSPDLHDVLTRTVYEVKPAWRVEQPTDEMQRKMAALQSSGWCAAYLTDRDVDPC